MANTQDFASGTNAFMRGFSFIDDINHRKRQEKKLDERLALEDEDRKFQRSVQMQQMAERGQDRANSLVDRQRNLKDDQRQREANALLADPNTDFEKLKDYADLPGVSAILRQQGVDIRDQADLEALQGGGGLRQQVTGQPQSQVTQQPGTRGLSSQVQAALLPGAAGSQGAVLTKRDLNEIAATEGAAAAMQVRDQQAAVLAANGPQPGDELPVAGGTGPLGITTAGAKRREAENKANRAALDTVNTEWEAFNNIEDRGGDGLRNLNSNILTAKYFDDRGSISDPERRQTSDNLMRPAIIETIQTQQEIITNAEPKSLEATNARRKLSEAYGLANEINITYSPLVAAGVDDRGLPIGGNNALTDSVIQQTIEGPGAPLPPHPSMTQADTTMLNRGASGNRVNARFATAAFRQYKNGRLNFVQYESLMRTGALPVAAPTISQTDPTKDTWMTYVDPNTQQTVRKLIIPARDPDKENTAGRNLINDDGLAHINRIAGAYDTKDDPSRGIRLANSFVSALAQNENKARTMGYDLSTVNDIGVLFERWTQLHVVRDQYNDEWFADGQLFPDFTENYGELDDALFNREVDMGVDRQSIADFTGEGSSAPPLTGLKTRDPAVYESIRQGAPEFANASDEDIEAVLQEQGL